MRFGAIYGNGAVMGFSPQDVRAMSIWQYAAAVEGFSDANTPESEKGLSSKEKDELWSFVQSP